MSVNPKIKKVWPKSDKKEYVVITFDVSQILVNLLPCPVVEMPDLFLRLGNCGIASFLLIFHQQHMVDRIEVFSMLKINFQI